MDPTSLLAAVTAFASSAAAGLGMAKDWLTRKNTPAMQSNARAQSDQTFLNKLDSDLDSGNIDSVRKDVSKTL